MTSFGHTYDRSEGHRCSRTAVSFSVVMALALILSACTALPSDPEERAQVVALNDPLEPTNRVIFKANKAVLDPVVSLYNTAPEPVRKAVGNVLTNMREPYVLINDLLQARTCAAGKTLSRFVINTTAGLGGLMDVAYEKQKIAGHDNNFGQTLAVWGVPSGPYIVLPLLGPSDLRGTVGIIPELYADPVDIGLAQAGLGVVQWIRTGADIIDERAANQADLETLFSTALDPYSSLRSAYRQNFTEQVR